MRNLYTNYSEEELLSLIKEEDGNAFSEFYSRHWSALYNSAYSILRDKEQCKDIVQSVFIDFWNRKEQIVNKNIIAFLHTAVRFQVYKYFSKKSLNIPFFKEIEDMLASSNKADSSLLESELQKLIDLWIAALPDKRRTIFLMRYFDDISTQQIANHLDLSQKTVQNQLNIASTHIRSLFNHFLIIAALALALFQK